MHQFMGFDLSDVQILTQIIRCRKRFFAICANPTNQPLSENTVQRRGDQIGFNADVYQPRDTPRRIIRMQRGQNQMSGQSGLNRDACGFLVADFTNHDDVGVLSEQRPQ